MKFAVQGNRLTGYSGEEKIVHIPPGIKSISKYAFSGNEIMRELYLSEGVEVIEENAFERCKNMRKAVLPDSLRTIGEFAFAHCSGLEELVLGDHLEWIEYGAFFACHKLKALRLPPTLWEIGGMAFSCCIALQELVIPNHLTTLGPECFSVCCGLRRVSLPASVETIGTRPFAWCGAQLDLQVDPDNPWFTAENGNLLSKDRSTLLCCPVSVGAAAVPGHITVLGEKALAGSNLTALTLPQGLQRIENGALCRCTKLKNLSLPEGLRWIGDGAFAYSGITDLVIPEKVEHIGKGALSGCRVHHVIIPGREIEMELLCFDKNLQEDAMLTADGLEIKDYPMPFTAVHGLRSVAAHLAAGEEISEAVQQRFRAYLAEHYAEHWEDPQILALMVSLKALPVERMDETLRLATEMKDPNITAALLEYQHKTFSQQQVDEQWRREFRREE